MSKQVIINADDYGMTPGTTEGIIRCARAGAISSTSMLATGASFDEAVKRAPELGGISIGVHLDATEGIPLLRAQDAPTLVDASTSRFKDPRIDANLTALRPEELKAEFKLQIERVLGAGIRVSHLDNHQNWIYFSPPHFSVVVELASEFGISMRYPFAGFSDERILSTAPRYKKTADELRSVISAYSLALLQKRSVKYPDHFWYEFTSVHRTQDALMELLQRLPEGISEIMVHPGQDTPRQKEELQILLEAADRGVFQNRAWSLVGYQKVQAQ